MNSVSRAKLLEIIVIFKVWNHEQQEFNSNVSGFSSQKPTVLCVKRISLFKHFTILYVVYKLKAAVEAKVEVKIFHKSNVKRQYKLNQ